MISDRVISHMYDCTGALGLVIMASSTYIRDGLSWQYGAIILLAVFAMARGYYRHSRGMP